MSEKVKVRRGLNSQINHEEVVQTPPRGGAARTPCLAGTIPSGYSVAAQNNESICEAAT